MTASKTNYLHACFKTFREVIEKKYSRPFDLPAIEKSVKHLRGETPLSHSDLTQFESPKHWWFEKFWVFPPEHHVTPGLKRRKFNFWILPKHEGDVIRSLYEVFKSIELVSIILRFIKPEDYGIISPPVERVLDVRRGSDAVETYLNYLEDLRAIAKHYHFARVADADMALWVVHEKCYGEEKDRQVDKEYHSDGFLLSLRAKNLMGYFFGQYTYAELAKALGPVNPQLAAQIGGIAFERMVRDMASRHKHGNEEDLDLKAMIEALRTEKVIDSVTAGRWQAARRTRNKAIHGEGAPNTAEVMRLLEILAT
jgi:Domain of unknown function (DUF4145)